MEILINSSGYLMIKRAGIYQEQRCPYSTDKSCGDWCPLFGEPNYFKDEMENINIDDLVLCHTELTGTIIDKRAEAKDAVKE